MNTTANRNYKRLRKVKIASCSFCPWHRLENPKGRSPINYRRNPTTRELLQEVEGD